MDDPNATTIHPAPGTTLRLHESHPWPRLAHAHEPWQYVYAVAVCPLLPVLGLEALEVALTNDDLEVQQRHDVQPPDVYGMAHLAPHTACSMAYALWKGLDLARSADVATHLERVTRRLGYERLLVVRSYEYSTPRDVWRRQLAEVVHDYLVSLVAERVA